MTVRRKQVTLSILRNTRDGKPTHLICCVINIYLFARNFYQLIDDAKPKSPVAVGEGRHS